MDFLKSRKFHFNMMRIGCFFHLHVFLLLASRGIVLLYQFQFVAVGGKNKVHNPDEIMNFPDARSFTQITLQIVTIIRVYEIYAASFCFFGLVSAFLLDIFGRIISLPRWLSALSPLFSSVITRFV